jgi:hypothetical protein
MGKNADTYVAVVSNLAQNGELVEDHAYGMIIWSHN